MQIFPPCMLCPDHIGSEQQGGNFHHSPVISCAPSCSAHHSAPREGLPVPVLRCHPCNLSLSGEKVHMQSWIPRMLVKLGALFVLQIGRTKINGMFCKALCSKKRSSFSIYYIFSLLFCHYICLLHNFSVSKNMVSFPDVHILCFLWVLILAYLIVAGIGHLLAISLNCPSVDLTVTLLKRMQLLQSYRATINNI